MIRHSIIIQQDNSLAFGNEVKYQLKKYELQGYHCEIQYSFGSDTYTALLLVSDDEEERNV